LQYDNSELPDLGMRRSAARRGAVGLFVLAYNLAVLVDDASHIAPGNNG